MTVARLVSLGLVRGGAASAPAWDLSTPGSLHGYVPFFWEYLPLLPTPPYLLGSNKRLFIYFEKSCSEGGGTSSLTLPHMNLLEHSNHTPAITFYLYSLTCLYPPWTMGSLEDGVVSPPLLFSPPSPLEPRQLLLNTDEGGRV